MDFWETPMFDFKIGGLLPVSFRRSIAADKSLTQPRNADGEEVLNEACDLLFLPPDPLVISRDDEDELWLVTGLVIELIEGELLASGNKISTWLSNTNDYHQNKKSIATWVLFIITSRYTANSLVVTFLIPINLFIVPNTYRNRVI